MILLEPGITIVTGTNTDVGKTITTAALACALERAGRAPVLVKPAQTGLAPGEPGDVHEAARLAGVPAERTYELVRMPEPLAPTTAAARARMTVPTVADHARTIADLAQIHDTVLVEGAGGIRVGLDGAGAGLIELAAALAGFGHPARFVVVAAPDLGTLNITRLTCDCLRQHGCAITGLVLGSWPDHPDLAMSCNRAEIDAAAGAPLLACLPAGLGSCRPEVFTERIRHV